MENYIVAIIYIVVNFVIIYYITRYVYNPKKMIGKQGKKGEQGNQGRRGYQGPQGIEGNRGNQGSKGPRGDRGENGRCWRDSDRCANTIQEWASGHSSSHKGRLKGGYLKPIRGDCAQGGGILLDGKCWRTGLCPFGYNLICDDSNRWGTTRRWDKNCYCSAENHDQALKIGSNNTNINELCDISMEGLKTDSYDSKIEYNNWLKHLIKRGCPNIPNVLV